ncbi:MAG TPA: hypothetical protein VFU06_11990 [Longimicrobiales bacterium]|nr:hypothetical protein [Longimicrobiales bacterium]
MADEELQSRTPNHLKVIAFLGGALAWTLHLATCYVVVALACTTGWGGAKVTVAVLTVIFGALGIAAGALALREWRRVQHAPSWTHALNESGGHEGLIYMIGVMLAALFVALIVLNGMSPFLVPVCSP